MATHGDVGALVLPHQLLLTVLFHQGGAFHNYPVLGPVVMHLQRQARARVHGNTLHLPAAAFRHACVGTPGPVNLAMGFPFRTAIGLKLLHHGLDLLGLGAVRDQYGVIGFDDHEVFHPKADHQAVFAAQVAVAAAFTDDATLQNVAIAVAIAGFPECAPAAHVAPACIQGQHGPKFGLLHHGHVDGDVGAFGEGFPFQAQEVEVGTVLFQGSAAAAHHLRCQPLQLRQHGAGFEQEHATVPGEAARRQKLLRRRLIRLFHKAGDGDVLQFSGLEGFGGLDVAIARFRRCRHDAEGHQSTGFCGLAA